MSTSRELRWIRAVQSGRLVYITAWLPLMTVLPALIAFALVSSKTIPLNAPENDLRLQYAFNPSPVKAKPPVTPDAKSNAAASQSTAPGDEQSDPDLLNDYLRGLAGLVSRAKRYPRRLKSEQIEGEVRIRIKVDRSGALKGVQVLAPSPHAGFNRAAQEAVQRALPFPPMPEGVRRESAQLQLRLRFVLQ